MDAFYASVEQRDNPELRGKPVAVGGSRERGVVAAASYEARRFGVRSAMPSVTAKRKCPELIFVKPRFDVYRAVSHQIRAIFAEYTPLIEPLSLDEAYLDVTENLKAMPSATEIAEEIRARIRAETGLTASAGVSYNKFLAKMASDERKPDGLFVITPKMGPAFVENLPVGKFHGIGPVTRAKMEGLGIHNGGDLKGQTLPLPPAALRQGWPLLLLARAGHRRTTRLRRSHPQVDRRRDDVQRRSLHGRRGPSRPRAAHRQGVVLLRGLRPSEDGRRRSRPNTPTSSRSPAAGPSRSRSRREPCSRSYRVRAPRASLPRQQGHPAPRRDPFVARSRVGTPGKPATSIAALSQGGLPEVIKPERVESKPGSITVKIENKDRKQTCTVNGSRGSLSSRCRAQRNLRHGAAPPSYEE